MLENLKILLGFTDDDSRDDILSLIINLTTARLKLLIGGIEPPEELEHIIIDVAAARFNKIGSEGLSAHSLEGESQTFTNNEFDGFMSEIQAFLDSQKESSRGKVRFL
jgi:hypothetical protein